MPESGVLNTIAGLVVMLAALPTAASAQYNFTQSSLPSGGVAPIIVETADFNGDGYSDIAVLNLVQDADQINSGNPTNSTLTVYLSNGDGTFGNATTIVLPCVAFSFRARPLITKGPVGLLVTCAGSNEIVVYPGLGNGSFGNGVATQPSPGILGFTDIMRFAMADFNGDGKLDIAYIALNSQFTLQNDNASDIDLVGPLQILFGNGDGTFGNGETIAGVSGISVSPGDLNGDGNADLVVSTPPTFNLNALSDSSQFPVAPGNIEILLGDGQGNFTLQNTYGVSFSPLTQTVSDVNGDGIPDIVVTGFEAGPAVFPGNGDGSFTQEPSTNENVVGHAAIADLRSIGQPDAILPLTATPNGSNITPGTAVILPGNGDGTFGAAQPILGNVLADSVAVGDFDGNGTPDLVFAVSFINLNDLANSDATPEPGTLSVLINLDPRAVNAASFATGSLASDSIAAMFGVGLAAKAVLSDPTLGLGTTLGGVTLSVQDSTGTSRAAPLFYVSPKQINFEIPAGTAAGPATLTVINGASTIAMTKQIVTLAPGIFELNGNGLAAAVVLRLKGGSTTNEDIEKIYQISNGKIVALPLDLGLANNDQVYLEIYGTGIRSAKTVTATVAGTAVPVHFHGASGDVGEDQVNIGPLPASLAGMGSATLVLTADGIASNATFLVVK